MLSDQQSKENNSFLLKSISDPSLTVNGADSMSRPARLRGRQQTKGLIKIIIDCRTSRLFNFTGQMMASEHHKKGKISEQAHGINCGYRWSEIAVLKLKASEGVGDLFFL